VVQILAPPFAPSLAYSLKINYHNLWWIKYSFSRKRQAFKLESDDQFFMALLNMANAIVKYCEDHGQGTPEGMGEIALAA
jgi:hypothetical protein